VPACVFLFWGGEKSSSSWIRKIPLLKGGEEEKKKVDGHPPFTVPQKKGGEEKGGGGRNFAEGTSFLSRRLEKKLNRPFRGEKKKKKGGASPEVLYCLFERKREDRKKNPSRGKKEEREKKGEKEGGNIENGSLRVSPLKKRKERKGGGGE